MTEQQDRELTVEELDVEDMVGNMHLRIGEAWGVVEASSSHPDTRGRMERRELADRLWTLIPFIKALGRLALEHPERARRLWAEALREPMPLRGEAIGMPRVANRTGISDRFDPAGPNADLNPPAPLYPPMTPAERDWAERDGLYRAPELLTERGKAVCAELGRELEAKLQKELEAKLQKGRGDV